jgi:hypothetical protein
MTLAEVGRLTREHEATVSRQVAKTRKMLRADVERRLRDEAHLSDAEIAQSFVYAIDDPGPIDLTQLLAPEAERKESGGHRSI